jgi:hypothetical protein
MSNENVRKRRRGVVACAKRTNKWIDRELAECTFKDKRLERRFRSLLTQFSASPGDSIPLVCQDWANTKAAYRFLDNERVDEAQILAGHFQATSDRFAKTAGLILVLHDTTEFSYKRDNVDAVGRTFAGVAGVDLGGRLRRYTGCGILMHSSLAITTEGLPLGLTAVKFWTREKFKGTNALKKRINPTRVPIEEKESIRWLDNLKRSTTLLGDATRCVHIGDRESDIYELFCAAKDAGTHFLLRTCVDRLAGDGTHTIAAEMTEAHCKGLHRLEVHDRFGEVRKAVLEIKYQRMHVLPPIAKQNRCPPLELTVLHVSERGKPRSGEPIDWKLITALPITSRAEAIEKLHWYAQRWKIESFHKILKSGCRAEQSRLRSAERLVNLLATFCILGWRIFWLTMMNRSTDNAKPTLAFTALEIELLNRLASDPNRSRSQSLHSCLTQLARLGGYLDRASDPPPGNTVIWRGLSRLTDIEIGFLLGAQHVGN